MRLLGLTAILFAFLAGCSDGPGPSSIADAAPVTDEATACKPPETNNYGTQVQDLYVVDGEVWQETNGIQALQKVESCGGPADSRLA